MQVLSNNFGILFDYILQSIGECFEGTVSETLKNHQI